MDVLLREWDDAREEISASIGDILSVIVQAAKELVPKEHGDLQEAIGYTMSYGLGNQRGTALAQVTVIGIPYAALQHETPPPPEEGNLVSQLGGNVPTSLLQRVKNRSGNAEEKAAIREQTRQHYTEDGAMVGSPYTGYYSHEHGRPWEPRSWKFIEIPMHLYSADVYSRTADNFIGALKRILGQVGKSSAVPQATMQFKLGYNQRTGG
jgi:hypothetical protein